MSEGLGHLNGPLGQAVLNALDLAVAEAAPLVDSTCNLCERAFAVRLPATAVVMKVQHQGRTIPVSVIVRLCAPCRARAFSEEVVPDGGPQT